MAGFSERLAEEEDGIGSSMESFQKCLESQKILFHSQIDDMRRVLVTQCRLTGANPLSQEMAAGALGIPFGKKPRDLLNPKAVAYMQEVFAIKDKISKKETREISTQFGITLAQVREFFVSQRIRVRDVVQSSQEVFRDRSKELNQLQYGNQENQDPVMPSDPFPVLTTGRVVCDTNMSNDVDPATKEYVSQSASVPVVTPSRSDSPEFSLFTCIPITDEEDNPVEPCQSETTSQKSMSSTFAGHLPLNVVPFTSSKPPISNNAGNIGDGKHFKSRQEEITPGLDGSDKNFVENIFNLMSQEKTFSGQVKLMEGILKIENPSLLDWFLSKGGVMHLATWLGEAAIEEQTSVLHVILKVLCHLPLAKAVPEHMSVILQSVNSLRFYRTQDISKKARILLARWSKLFAKTQPMRTNGVKSQSDATKQTLLSQSIKEITSDESRQLQLENTDERHTPSNEAPGNLRKREGPAPMELLTSSADESIKRKSLGLPSSQGKDRRKVQLVEHPGQKLKGRSQQGARSSVIQSRPVSTDDIQKAKLRKEFMEAKYGKKKPETESGKQGISQASQVSTESIPNGRHRNPKSYIPKTVTENKAAAIPDSYCIDEKEHNLFPPRNTELKQSMMSVQSSNVELELPEAPFPDDTKEQLMMTKAEMYSEQTMDPLASSKTQSQVYPENCARQTKPLVSITNSNSIAEPLIKSKGAAEQRQPMVPDQRNMVQQNVRRQKKTIPESKEPFWKQCKRVQIPWKVPPEIIIDQEWGVVYGQNSRELQDQKSRNKREKEFVYQRPEEIPQNPKNPWENEIDYDDSLTPIIPVEQVLDTTDTVQSQISMPLSTDNVSQTSVPPTNVSTPLPGGVSSAVHDPVLLDALLKNPALVFTLTSGQGTNMTSEATVRLLDLIKATGGDLPTGNITHSLAQGVLVTGERVEGSLPSPTPSTNHGMSGWQPEVARNAFLRNSPTPNIGMYTYQGVAAPAYDKHPPLAHSQLSSANNFQPLESTVPQFRQPQTFGTQYSSNFSNSILHSPTPHADTISSVNPYQHPISNETGMLENRSAVGYNQMQIYSSYAPGQSQQLPVYDNLSQPTYYSSGRLQSESIYEHQPHRQSPTYAARGQHESPGPLSDSWRQRGFPADSNAQVNSNHYDSTYRYKDENVTSLNQFESWSPPRSGPSMSVDYVSGSSQPRTAYGSNYRPDQAKPAKFPSGYGGTNQNANRWWNERDRRY